MSGDLADAAARLLEGRTSRRGLLIRLAVAGSAIVVAPLRYLLRPGTAMAVITCSQCGGGARCCDGWTDFCCVINNGINACPSYTYIAGWWKCTNYTGTNICHSRGRPLLHRLQPQARDALPARLLVRERFLLEPIDVLQRVQATASATRRWRRRRRSSAG